jgi:hypothetical protein
MTLGIPLQILYLRYQKQLSTCDEKLHFTSLLSRISSNLKGDEFEAKPFSLLELEKSENIDLMLYHYG